jgi:membrane-associated phospholipid phosphatase
MKNIDNDFNEFKKYHKNKYNRLIHILSFLIGFIAFCFLFKNDYIKYTIVLLYIGSIILTYYNIILITIITILLIIILLVFKYFNNTNKITLILIIILTYIIPELSHIYFKENTYLYNRLNKEQNIFMIIIQLFKHSINLVPYCILSK